MLPIPMDLPQWLAENSHLLRPPINNYCVYRDGGTVMVVGGPNARTDYHINCTAEFFYQYKGSMLLKVIDPDTGAFIDVPIREGEMFLLPANVPHNPIRFAETVGVVVEQPRPANSLDRLRWYCQQCKTIAYEAAFECVDLGSQIKDAVIAFAQDKEKRTCRSCGTIVDTVPSGIVQP